LWRRFAQLVERHVQSDALLVHTPPDFLKLGFEGMNALSEFAQIFLILLAEPRGRVGANQGYNRARENEPDDAQRDQNPKAFHESSLPRKLRRMLSPKRRANNPTAEA
jgi:hypothetical protein